MSSAPAPAPAPTVTFIIPSVGRPTLLRTLRALLTLDTVPGGRHPDPQWRAIVVLDGLPQPPADVAALAAADTAQRIRLECIPKTGTANHAGRVRNHGMALAVTPWLAFVDDDDVLTPDYLVRFFEEIAAHPTADVVVFRMLDPYMGVLPPRDATALARTKVGISFALRRALFASGEARFEPSSTEDFDLLNRLHAAGRRLLLSKHLTYLVRPELLQNDARPAVDPRKAEAQARAQAQAQAQVQAQAQARARAQAAAEASTALGGGNVDLPPELRLNRGR